MTAETEDAACVLCKIPVKLYLSWQILSLIDVYFARAAVQSHILVIAQVWVVLINDECGYGLFRSELGSNCVFDKELTPILSLEVN